MKWKQGWLLVVLSAILLFTGAVLAQNQGVTVWQATYWNNVSLAGDPALRRTEDIIDHNWGLGSPGAGVSQDRFSARWTTTLNLPAGRYRFSATVDDGIRIWVNELLLINNWRVQSPRTIEAEMELDGGRVPIRVEYFDNTERAIAQVSWTPVEVTSATWYAEYYNNRSLVGSPLLVRNDPAINFNWGQSSPAPDVLDPDVFSARWRRTVNLESGLYRFRLTVDDGARLWVDDELLIDAWRAQPATVYEEEISLPGGSVPIQLEYFENGGLAQVALNWNRVPTAQPTPRPTATPSGPPPLPEPNAVIVDDDDPGFVRGGNPAQDWNEEATGYGGSALSTTNGERLPAPYNWAQWRPDLTPGRYEVAAYIPAGFPSTTQARYWVAHDNGLSLRVVDQSVNQGRWVSLGTFDFDGAEDYVSLADLTLEDDQSTRVAYDAIRWSPVTTVSPGEPAMAITPRQVSAGDQVTVFGSGFPAGQMATLAAGPPNTEPFGRFAQARVGPDGTVRLTFVMPSTWPSGQSIVDTLPDERQLIFLLITEDGTQAVGSVLYQAAE